MFTWKFRDHNGKFEDMGTSTLAFTLSAGYIGKNASGWEISGEVKKDYCEWVNEFIAVHLVYGKVWGDFEKEVYADSEDGFNHFYENHTPNEWDYREI